MENRRPGLNAPLEWAGPDCNRLPNGNLSARETSMQKTAPVAPNGTAKMPRRFWQAFSKKLSDFTDEHFFTQKIWWMLIIDLYREENRPFPEKLTVAIYRVYELYHAIITSKIYFAKRALRDILATRDEIYRERKRRLGYKLDKARMTLNERRYIMASSGALPDAFRAYDYEIRQIDLWRNQCHSTKDEYMVYDQLRRRGLTDRDNFWLPEMGRIND